MSPPTITEVGEAVFVTAAPAAVTVSFELAEYPVMVPTGRLALVRAPGEVASRLAAVTAAALMKVSCPMIGLGVTALRVMVWVAPGATLGRTQVRTCPEIVVGTGTALPTT